MRDEPETRPTGELAEGLFPLPPGARRPRARVILLAGPSGSGKTALASHLGIPSLGLDDFYRDGTAPGLPHLHDGIVDWDSPLSWNRADAFEALLDLCRHGQADVPIYDIPSNRRTGARPVQLGAQPVFIAEGIFASELIDPLRDEGVLAAALCIARSPMRNAWFRLLRDLAEHRKSVPVLVMRGAMLARREPAKVRAWIRAGCQPVASLAEAERAIAAIARAEAAGR